jgi:hypothetical protein
MDQNTLPRLKHVGLECDDLSASCVFFFWIFALFFRDLLGSFYLDPLVAL